MEQMFKDFGGIGGIMGQKKYLEEDFPSRFQVGFQFSIYLDIPRVLDDKKLTFLFLIFLSGFVTVFDIIGLLDDVRPSSI